MTPRTFTWDGVNATEAAQRLGLKNVWMHAEVESTQDEAHKLAEQGVPAGALVVADAQRAGRGRHGRSWSSEPGRGVWCTIVERPSDSRSLDVLSLRVGLELAEALDRFADERVCVKWPNDLVIPSEAGVIPSEARNLPFRKLGGVLCEARWTGSMLGWIAIGVGVNVIAPVDEPDAAGLRPGTKRFDVLTSVVQAVRRAAVRSDAVRSEVLSQDELSRYRARDALAGRRIVLPVKGTVETIDDSGALLVRTRSGVEQVRAGTVEFEDEERRGA